MAEHGDIRTLEIGGGLYTTNGVLYATMNKDILEYLGTTLDAVKDGKDKLVIKFDKGRHGFFIGIGKKD